MNNKELQAIRKVLMLDVSEAAAHIGGVNVRTWQYWEAERFPVPTHVEEKLRHLLAMRINILSAIDARILENKGAKIRLPFYAYFDEYQSATQDPNATVIEWRLSQSVIAQYYTAGYISMD